MTLANAGINIIRCGNRKDLDRVHALGVGSKPIPQKKMTVEKLAAAIREVTTDQIIRQNAEALGKKIRKEDGVANAVAIIERTGIEV